MNTWSLPNQVYTFINTYLNWPLKETNNDFKSIVNHFFLAKETFLRSARLWVIFGCTVDICMVVFIPIVLTFKCTCAWRQDPTPTPAFLIEISLKSCTQHVPYQYLRGEGGWVLSTNTCLKWRKFVVVK